MIKKSITSQKFKFAISKLTILKNGFENASQNKLVKEQAIAIIREFGDDKMVQQFKDATRDGVYTTPDVLSEKIDTALEVAIEDFKNKDMFNDVVDSQKDEPSSKMFAYSPWFIIALLVFVMISNWELVLQFKLNTKQWFLLALFTGVSFAVAFIKKSAMGERVFQVILVILGAILARIVMEF